MGDKHTGEYIICLDSDGVFSDFTSLMKEHGVTNRDKHMWATLEKVPNAFLHLKVLPGALDLYHAIKHHKHYVLTAIPRPTGHFKTAKEDKVKWWAKHVHPSIDVVVVSSGKQKSFHAAPNKVLIDDLPRNIDMWIEAGGVGILHTSVDSTLEKLRSRGIV